MRSISILLLSLHISHAAWAQEPSGASTATGISRIFNPAISVNGLFLGTLTSHAFEEEEDSLLIQDHDYEHVLEAGLAVEEVEVQMTSFVDPFLKADLIFAMEGIEGIELEEGFVTTQGLPSSLMVRGGKFLSAFGKQNILHTHQFPFVDNNLANEEIFGHSLNEVGVEGSYLMPLSWYSEVILEILNGDNDNLFNSPEPKDLAYVGHGKNLWDLSESTTLEIGGSGAFGKNEVEKWSRVIGADLTVKWRPLRRAKYRGAVFQGEILHRSIQDTLGGEEKDLGFSLLSQFQFSRRWWIQGRFDTFDLMGEEEGPWRVSGLLAFVPTEFSALRFQYNLIQEGEEMEHEGKVQLNFTIGSHPAHKY